MSEEWKQIEAVLDEKVRPSLRAHGGELEIDHLEDGVLYIKLLGQCAGCPSADLTNETLIEHELTAALPELVQKYPYDPAKAKELLAQADMEQIQQVLYNLNVGLIEFSLQDYESVLTLFQEICQNNETKKIDINVNVKNGFMIIEFIFKPKKEMAYGADNRYILKEKIADYESIKYVLKL